MPLVAVCPDISLYSRVRQGRSTYLGYVAQRNAGRLCAVSNTVIGGCADRRWAGGGAALIALCGRLGFIRARMSPSAAAFAALGLREVEAAGLIAGRAP